MHKIQFCSSFKPETLQALKLVEYNHSFSSVEEESKCFKMIIYECRREISTKHLKKNMQYNMELPTIFVIYLKLVLQATPLTSFSMKPHHPK